MFCNYTLQSQPPTQINADLWIYTDLKVRISRVNRCAKPLSALELLCFGGDHSCKPISGSGVAMIQLEYQVVLVLSQGVVAGSGGCIGSAQQIGDVGAAETVDAHILVSGFD